MWKWINNCGSVYFNFARPYFHCQQWWLKHLFYCFWMSLKLFDNRIKIQQNIQTTQENRKQYKWKLHRILFVCLCCLLAFFWNLCCSFLLFSAWRQHEKSEKKSMKIINMNMRAKSILHNNFSILLISTTIGKFLLFKIQALHYFLQNQTA